MLKIYFLCKLWDGLKILENKIVNCQEVLKVWNSSLGQNLSRTLSFMTCSLNSALWKQDLNNAVVLIFSWPHLSPPPEAERVPGHAKRGGNIRMHREKASVCETEPSQLRFGLKLLSSSWKKLPLLQKCQTVRTLSHESSRVELKGRNSEQGTYRDLHWWTVDAEVCWIFLQVSQQIITEAAQSGRLNSSPTANCFHGGQRAHPHIRHPPTPSSLALQTHSSCLVSCSNIPLWATLFYMAVAPNIAIHRAPRCFLAHPLIPRFQQTPC